MDSDGGHGSAATVTVAQLLHARDAGDEVGDVSLDLIRWQIVAGFRVRLTEIAADEVVSGTFRNLAGTVTAVDPSASTLTLKDAMSKQSVVVKVSSDGLCSFASAAMAVESIPPDRNEPTVTSAS